MKLTRIFAMLLALAMLLGACSTAPQPTEAPVPATEPVIVTEPTVPATEPPATEPAKADFHDLVFDTSSDAGRLTARYLYMTKTEGSDKDYVYPGDCTVYTSPDGYVMVVDASNRVSGDDIIAQLEAIGITQARRGTLGRDTLPCGAEQRTPLAARPADIHRPQEPDTRTACRYRAPRSR